MGLGKKKAKFDLKIFQDEEIGCQHTRVVEEHSDPPFIVLYLQMYNVVSPMIINYELCVLLLNRSPDFRRVMASRAKVVVTGLGAVCPLGVGVQDAWVKLCRCDA